MGKQHHMRHLVLADKADRPSFEHSNEVSSAVVVPPDVGHQNASTTDAQRTVAFRAVRAGELHPEIFRPSRHAQTSNLVSASRDGHGTGIRAYTDKTGTLHQLPRHDRDTTAAARRGAKLPRLHEAGHP
ncbi:hypothetical protein [Streptomyces lavendulae]|uniref:hypothetical protein n=1 Tax=Streptomyces lavendulae TaxID=1914 RepID=UPI0036E96C5E